MYLPIFNQDGSTPSELNFWNKCANPTVVNGINLIYRFLYNQVEENTLPPRKIGYYIIEDEVNLPEITLHSSSQIAANRKPATRGFLPTEISGYLDLANKQIIPNPFYIGSTHALDKKQGEPDLEENHMHFSI